MKQRHDHMARRIWMSILGVLLCGAGIGFFKFASFGVDPFQSLMAGLHQLIPISFGFLYILANLLLLLFSLIFDRSKIGLATIINLTILGYVVDFSHQFLVQMIPAASLPIRVVMLVIGLGILAVSCSLYFTADLGVSTYDAIALVANERWPSISFKFYRVATDLVCVAGGVALFLLSGHPVSELGSVAGVGTILTACCLGPLIEFCNLHISRKILNR